jgi:hypothetical protein
LNQEVKALFGKPSWEYKTDDIPWYGYCNIPTLEPIVTGFSQVGGWTDVYDILGDNFFKEFVPVWISTLAKLVLLVALISWN